MDPGCGLAALSPLPPHREVTALRRPLLRNTHPTPVTTPDPPPARDQVGKSVDRTPCGPSSVNSVLLRRTSLSAYWMAFECFCYRPGIRHCAICPWQQILQLAHGLGIPMHARLVRRLHSAARGALLRGSSAVIQNTQFFFLVSASVFSQILHFAMVTVLW